MEYVLHAFPTQDIPCAQGAAKPVLPCAATRPSPHEGAGPFKFLAPYMGAGPLKSLAPYTGTTPFQFLAPPFAPRLAWHASCPLTEASEPEAPHPAAPADMLQGTTPAAGGPLWKS